MPTILITGAASGLGAAFLTHYNTNPSNKIFALDINPIPTSHASHPENIHPHTLDLTNEPALLSYATSIATEPIHLLLHSAGIRGLVPALSSQHPTNVAAAETLSAIDLETIMQTFQTNTLATFALLRALLPNLLISLQQPGTQPKVIIMSSRMGSLSNNTLPNPSAGSAYAYRASKAAVNMIVRSLAMDVPEVVWVLCHPGRVATGLVRGREEGAIEAEESVEGMVRLIEGWGVGDSGGFYDRFGEVIPW